MGPISFNMADPLATGLTAVTVCVPISLSEGDVLTDSPFFSGLVRAGDIYSGRYVIICESFPSSCFLNLTN